MIEVELRSFVNEAKYNELVSFFEKNAKSKGVQKQITSYFNSDKDLRLMVTDDDYCQLWLKKGKIHQDAREEMIVKLDKKYKDTLFKMFEEISLPVKIKWYRIRKSFEWNDINIELDYTYGYGHIIELESVINDESQVAAAKEHLTNILNELNIPLSEKELFNEKFKDYEKNWSTYTKGLDEDSFMAM